MANVNKKTNSSRFAVEYIFATTKHLLEIINKYSLMLNITASDKSNHLDSDS